MRTDLTLRPINTTELFVRWQQRSDAQARDELVQFFLPLAANLARRYSGAHEPIEDLQQVATLGLLKAIDRFDPEQGHAFSSFAVPTILGELKRYFRDFGWSVHVPRGIQEAALRVEKAQQQLGTAAGRSPSVDELAQYLGWRVEDVLDALEAGSAHHSVSLDAPSDDHEDEAMTLGDSLGGADRRLEFVEDQLSLAAAARRLSDRERRVLTLRFIRDQTQTEIAALMGISQMQVSRILRGAIEQLREATGGSEI